MAYGSLGSSLLGGARLRAPAVLRVAERRQRSAAQVLLRWAVQQGMAVIPRGPRKLLSPLFWLKSMAFGGSPSSSGRLRSIGL